MIIRNLNGTDPQKAEFERLKVEYSKLSEQINILELQKLKSQREIGRREEFIVSAKSQIHELSEERREIAFKMHDIQAEWEIQLDDQERNGQK